MLTLFLQSKKHVFSNLQTSLVNINNHKLGNAVISGKRSREIQVLTESIKHLPASGVEYVWLLWRTQSSYSYSFSYQLSICFGKHDCNCSALLSIGSIGAELTSSNVSMFITSDAGNTWRQVTLTVGCSARWGWAVISPLMHIFERINPCAAFQSR